MDFEKATETKFKRRRHRRSDLSITYRCAVCGDKTNCYNFGVPACEGCKGFYRRHMKRIGEMVCSKDGNCEISVETRKACLACRMRKCCEVGMQRDPLTKDTVAKPRRRRLKAPGEQLRRGRKPGSKLNQTEQKVPEAASRNKNKASSTKLADKTEQSRPTKATNGDSTAVTVDKPSSASVSVSSLLNTSELNANVAKRLALSAQYEDSNVRSQEEQHASDNGVLAYAYLSENPSSVCTGGSPRSVSSVPPKKRKLVMMDGMEGSPCPSRNDSGMWGNSFAQLSTRSDADSNQYRANDTSYVLSNDLSLCNTLVNHSKQVALSCSDQLRSVAGCGSADENQRSTLHPSILPAAATVERTEDSACMVHDLEADSFYEIPEAVYEQIMSDCLNLATIMSAPWRREELGSTLYDDPAIPDGSYQLRYMESRLHRLVFTLKPARCFSTLTDAEKFVVMKAAMPNVFLPIVAHCVPDTGASVIERFDDGRIYERLCSDAVRVYLQYGIDLRHMFDLTRKFHLSLCSSPLAGDLPVLISIFIITMMFQVSVKQVELECLLPSSASVPLPAEDHQERTRRLAALHNALEMKLAWIRREHAAFLRRFVSQVEGKNSTGNEMWHFCIARLEELTLISKIGSGVTRDFFKFGPAMVDKILPVIDEVMAPKLDADN